MESVAHEPKGGVPPEVAKTPLLAPIEVLNSKYLEVYRNRFREFMVYIVTNIPFNIGIKNEVAEYTKNVIESDDFLIKEIHWFVNTFKNFEEELGNFNINMLKEKCNSLGTNLMLFGGKLDLILVLETCLKLENGKEKIKEVWMHLQSIYVCGNLVMQEKNLYSFLKLVKEKDKNTTSFGGDSIESSVKQIKEMLGGLEAMRGTVIGEIIEDVIEEIAVIIKEQVTSGDLDPHKLISEIMSGNFDGGARTPSGAFGSNSKIFKNIASKIEKKLKGRNINKDQLKKEAKQLIESLMNAPGVKEAMADNPIMSTMFSQIIGMSNLTRHFATGTKGDPFGISGKNSEKAKKRRQRLFRK